MVKKIKILVISDRDDDLPTLTKSLEEELGAEVEYTSSSKRCMEKLAQNGYDGIVIDYHLLGETGLNVLKVIREKHGDVALIVLVDQQEEMVRDCLKGGADDYVTKISGYLSVLPLVVNQVLQKRDLLKRERLFHREFVRLTKFSAMGRHILGIGHNMNSHLTSIMGRAQLCIEREERERRELLARKDTIPAEEFEKQLKRYEKTLYDLNSIHEAAIRLSLMIKNMTYKGHQEQNEAPQYLNLNELLREELNFLEADMFFKHEVTKHYEFAESLPHIRGVYSDFSQSLMMIIQSALEAMRSTEKKELTVSTSWNGRSISVKIHHTGCGSSEGSIDTSHNLLLSIGQSLTRSVELLKPYGAHISSTRQPGDTTFTVEIPESREKS